MARTEQGTRYRVIKRLGAGGMATVSLAEDTLLGRFVALKRVYRTGDGRNMLRLKREAMVGASLNHPNLVFVYDAQLQDDGDVVIVMEYVEGQTLAELIGARGALPPAEVIRVLRGVGAALDAIHDRGIVHRDVKPANVLLGRDETVKLADLGVADVADRTRITTPDALVGSFSYMAPEQLDGAAPRPAMDVYALAAMAYEMLAGEKARPESNPLALAHAIATRPPPDLRSAWPAAPAAAAAVLQRGMSSDPAQRPASAGELVRRLEAALEPEQPTRVVAGAPPQAPRQPRRRRSLLAPMLLALAALAVAGVLVIALRPGSKPATGTSTAQKAPGKSGRTTAHRRATTTASTPTTTASTPTTTASTPTTPATTTSTAIPPPAASAATAPVSAVEHFYESAANHQYPAAWALADANLRSQLGGYTAFQHQMSAVRSITFHRAQVVSGAGAGAATVSLQTTSVQADRTQECSGTARTVRAAGTWMVDAISINCS
jgi:eukaryotic-like serine/threonine-protein kinase